MKREKLKAIQYTVPTSEVLGREEYKNYDYSVLTLVPLIHIESIIGF
jgi:hypothetical protein